MILEKKKLKPSSSYFLSQRFWRFLRNILPVNLWSFFYVLVQKIKSPIYIKALKDSDLTFKGEKTLIAHTITINNLKNNISYFLKKNKTTKPDNGYLDYLDNNFSKYKNAENILEVGVAYGSGIFSFIEFFETSKIIGIDIDPSTFINHSRVECYQADQLNRKNLRYTADKISKFYDIIIDDGWHHPEAQINTIIEFIPYLKPNGLMIIEDIVNNHYSSLFFNVQKILNKKNFKTRYINFSSSNFITPYGMSGILEIVRVV